MHCVLHDVCGYGLAERIPTHTRIPPMNATENAGVSDLRGRCREAGEGSGAGADFRSDGECRVIAKNTCENGSCRSAYSRMAGGIFRMSWSSARKEIEPRHKRCIDISGSVVIEISGTNRSDRAPVDIAILGIPAGDSSIRHGNVHLRKQVSVVQQRAGMLGGNLRSNAIPVEWCVAIPEQGYFGLVSRSLRSSKNAHGFHFVVVGGISGAGQRGRRLQTELRWPRQHPRRHGGELRPRSRRVEKWSWAPDSDSGRRSDDAKRAFKRRRRWVDSICQSPSPNAVGNELTPCDAIIDGRCTLLGAERCDGCIALCR